MKHTDPSSNFPTEPTVIIPCAVDVLADWEYEMDRDSRAALVFNRFLPQYRDAVFSKRLEDAGLADRRDVTECYGDDRVLLQLDPESAWSPASRDAKIASALEAALEEIDE